MNIRSITVRLFVFLAAMLLRPLAASAQGANADISASPTTPAPGSSVTVSYSMANPTSTDWIALSPAGASLQTYWDWKYAGSCTQTPGASKASGSCHFTAPSTAGAYEFRLFANNVFMLLDTVTSTVTTSASSADISASPTTPAPGSSVTVSYSMANPTSTDWIALSPAGASLQTYWDWKYAGSCTQTPGASKASGSCPFTAPSTAGAYEFRLFANNVFMLLDTATSTVTTSASSADISASPTTPAPGSSVTVSYSVANPTSTDWIALSPAGASPQTYWDWKYAGSCTQTPGASKASGSCPFTAPSTAGAYEFRLFANNVFMLLDTVTSTVTTSASVPPPPPPPSTSAKGPQSAITCPAGAVDIFPGIDIQGIVNQYAGSTTFCLKVGIHYLRSAITPKSGNTFVGAYGAILDGTGWSTTDPNQGAFRAHNQDIDDVTIRNLVIRNMPQRGVHAFYQFSDRWTIEYNEITATQIGVSAPNSSVIRNNYIHHNSGGGYNGWLIVNTTFDTNEIAYNGTSEKILGTTNVTFRNNFIHHNRDSIHFDSDNSYGVIEGNRIEDSGRYGVFYEFSQQGVIRNNTVSRSGDTGIMVSMSKNVETYGNTLQDNFRAVQYFLNCSVIGAGTISYDLANNSTHDNNVRVNTTSGAFANGLTLLSTCTSTASAPYLGGSKNLRFQNNHYTVPYSGHWWVWGFNGFKYWSEWQALPQDSTGTVQ